MGNFPSDLRNAVDNNNPGWTERILDKAGDNAAQKINEDYSQDCIFLSCVRADGNAFFNAVSQNRLKIVQLMVTKGADINTSGKYGETCLHRAARNNFINMAKLLVESGCDVKATDDQGHYVIHACCMSSTNTSEFIRWLLQGVMSSEDVNARDFMGRTPLHEAADYGNYDVCKTLLECGADVNAISKEGNTPLHGRWAQKRAHVWQLLVEHGADINVANNQAIHPKANF